MIERREVALHKKLIQHLFEYLKWNNFRSIKADLAGAESPGVIKSGEYEIIPDITAYGDQFLIFEVETSETLHKDLARDKWLNFSKYASDEKGEFWIVVPEGHELEATNLLGEIGASAKVWAINAPTD